MDDQSIFVQFQLLQRRIATGIFYWAKIAEWLIWALPSETALQGLQNGLHTASSGMAPASWSPLPGDPGKAVGLQLQR